MVALFLATLGIYGVMAYSVTQRTPEIGVRMALGADALQILQWMLFRGLKLSFAGLLIGLGSALACTRLMASLLYQVAPTDAFTFLVVSVVLTVTAMAASIVPAWRAARTDPADALRAGRL
jgi:putative ABC transport system permease protein